MSSILDTTFTTAQLELSPRNVRPHTPDASDLEPSILAIGLKEPILVHPMLGRKSGFGVFAGGRRIKAIRALVKRGALPADWPIPVRLHEGFSDIDLEEMSLVENVGREDMKPHEIYAAVRKIVARGGTIDQIAGLLGRDPGEARRWLRLGQLAQPIFAALVAGEIDDEEARAYAATQDTTLQIAAFERLRGCEKWQRSAAAIRAALGFDDAENRRWLAYVGDDVYRGAGGTFELDLFASDAVQRGRVADPGLLRRLADAKLDSLRAELRAAAGRPSLRFVAEPPQHPHFAGPDGSLRIVTAAAPHAAAGALPAGDVVGYLAVHATGAVEVAWYWASRKSKHGATQPVRDSAITSAVREPDRKPVVAAGAALGAIASDPVRQQADAAIRRDEGISIEAVQIFASIRRRVLQAALVDDADRQDDGLAQDLFVWSQLRLVLNQSDRIRALGIRGLTTIDHDSAAALPHLSATAASRAWSNAIAELRTQSFMDGAELTGAFGDYRTSPARLKRVASAVVAGLALERSLDADGYSVPLHEELAYMLGLADPEAVRRWWEPTAAFLDLIPTRERLAIAEPFVERITLGAWQRIKSPDLSQRILELVTGAAAGVRRGMADAAARWVHPLLAFRPPGGAARSQVLETEEVA